MKQFQLLSEKEVFPTFDMIFKFTFKTTETGDSYALLSVKNRQLSMGFAILREKSAHFYKQDCFECPSPHKLAA